MTSGNTSVKKGVDIILQFCGFSFSIGSTYEEGKSNETEGWNLTSGVSQFHVKAGQPLFVYQWHMQ